MLSRLAPGSAEPQSYSTHSACTSSHCSGHLQHPGNWEPVVNRLPKGQAKRHKGKLSKKNTDCYPILETPSALCSCPFVILVCDVRGHTVGCINSYFPPLLPSLPYSSSLYPYQLPLLNDYTRHFHQFSSCTIPGLHTSLVTECSKEVQELQN